MNTKTRPLRVLIADDHAPSRDDVREALERDHRFGACLLAADAAEAIQAAVRERPDVCLLDIRMPGNGLAAAWEIAARLPQTKIVMLTVCDDDADLFAALRAGADGYLLKTMNLQQLPDMLDGIFSGGAAGMQAIWKPLETRSAPTPDASEGALSNGLATSMRRRRARREGRRRTRLSSASGACAGAGCQRSRGCRRHA